MGVRTAKTEGVNPSDRWFFALGPLGEMGVDGERQTIKTDVGIGFSEM